MARRTLLVLVMAGLTGLLAACASGPPKPTATSLPPPQALELSGQPNYQIGPYDVLQISMFGVPALSGATTVDGEGNITLPMIGRVSVLNKSPPALAEELEQKYLAYVRRPDVTVVVSQAVSRRVTVSGAVTEPGVFPVAARMSLVQAIALAKGLDEMADPRTVVVLRPMGTQQAAARFDLLAIQAGQAPDPEIFAGDAVIVDTSARRQFIRDLGPITSVFRILQ